MHVPFVLVNFCFRFCMVSSFSSTVQPAFRVFFHSNLNLTWILTWIMTLPCWKRSISLRIKHQTCPVYKLTLAYLFSQFDPFICLVKTLGILTFCHSRDTSNSFPLWDSHTCYSFPGKIFPFLPSALFTWKIPRQMTGYWLREEIPDYSV